MARSELTDVTAKVVIYEAFVERKNGGSRNSSCGLCMISTPSADGVWSRRNAFTSAFKEPDPSRNSRLPPNWESSWKYASQSRF